MKEITIKTSKRNQFVDITEHVKEAVTKSDIKDGFCIVYCPHTTAAITVNEGADPSVAKDILKKLNLLIPENENYSHAEGNSDSHIKASLVGCSQTIPVSNGELSLGTWQSIYFCEFDGPRERKFLIQLK